MNAPKEFKTFHDHLCNLGGKYGTDRIFDDFLDYIIANFSLNDDYEWKTKYDKDELKIFYGMLQEWICVTNQKIQGERDWFDFLGIYFESEIIANYHKKYDGMFFTPVNVCDLMAEMCVAEQQSQRIHDCACGSGRMLLAYNKFSANNTFFAWDISPVASKMCACNFLIHGLVGEVLHINSLTFEYFSGWRINEMLQKIGMPHLRKIKEKEANINIPNIKNNYKINSKQLTLF